MITRETLITDLKKVRANAPLVHNITNYVVMNNTANALLAIGASPVMAHAVDEVKDMVKLASSLVINIGTLSPDWIEAMIIAGKTANKRNIPVVFDPVGAGATSYRTHAAMQIIKECLLAVIRGNASEIMALAGSKPSTKGVDSIATSHDAIDAAMMLSEKTGSVVVISGAVDYVVYKNSLMKVRNGAPLMTKVTGMGCTATALVGAFSAVNSDYFHAAAHAMTVSGIAGEIAAERAEGPGSMQVYFLDALYKLKDEELISYFKVD